MLLSISATSWAVGAPATLNLRRVLGSSTFRPAASTSTWIDADSGVDGSKLMRPEKRVA
jgi:hypothetical protein